MNSSKTTPTNEINRREFITTAAVAGAGLLAAPSLLAADASAPRKRYALVGTGDRSGMYRTAINQTYAEHCEMVGYCDVNEGRLKLAQTKAREMGAKEIPLYKAADFDRMITETKPEVVIVTTKDATHNQYIIRAMELGCDVVTEKPMTTDEKKCHAIIEAQQRTGRHCRVTFNYRYSPPRTHVKDLLMSGVIGDVLSIDFHWLLDTIHGADYFRRWHSHKANSGGLMVHKATHHFDLVNWWLSAVPVSVMAKGKRDFYTPKMAQRFGLTGSHERCHTCPETDKCTFFLDLAASPKYKELYLDNEKYDGYFRDRCVFRPDIDIEDTMNVLVKYSSGATMSYSLNTFNAWEGYVIAFNGTKGRLEHSIVEKLPAGSGNIPGVKRVDTASIRIVPLRGEAYDISPWTGEGSHGGGDKVMLDDLFLPGKPADKYLRASDHRGGAYSILTGIAANHSFKTGKVVVIADLVPGMHLPEYPAMPSHDESVPMPPSGKQPA